MSSEPRSSEAHATGWRARFEVPIRVSSTRSPGGGGLELVLAVGKAGREVSFWDPETGAITPVGGLPALVDCPAPGPDGRSVLMLSDETGAEIGHLWSFPADGGPGTDLTPGLPEYVLRGSDVAQDGSAIVIAASAEDGFGLWLLPSGGQPRRLYQTRNEAWNSRVSADGAYASIDTTDHNPGTRRFAVTVADRDGAVLAMLSDGPEAPVRAVRFSPVPGDPRLLVSTERSGFARPAVWHPLTGARIDVDAPELTGDLVTLDWSDDAGLLLLAHVDEGIHRLYEYDLATAGLSRVDHPDGAYFSPDVASPLPCYWASHYGPGNEIRLVRQRFDRPLEVLSLDATRREPKTRLEPGPIVPGTRLKSERVVSKDGTKLQLWAARPPSATGPVPTILYIHGGPNLVTVDGYDPSAQAWLDEGFGFASLNYRGSVTFGRKFREGFWGAVGDRELEDVEAARNWLVDQGIAAEVFIAGASYGGFMTLLSLGRLPGLFAGGLASVAMADWRLAYDDMAPALQAAWRGFIGGTPESAPERFAYSSPLTYVEQVRAPVLLSQGRADSRTPARQAGEYVRRLTAAGGDAVLDWFEGGHETTSTVAMLEAHERELGLVRRALRGQRWSQR
ncbi:S9 family peptidase [Amycolatopsis saalfeldensis]|uniref:Dipeptidyl aminopeptidase/acylaminoacyl peptidase n=1 Tax=Amycolatopsis saalfeldensis TaxID=394193 RepID=A0A1H8YM27_9PSEU|nr:prolyl oligopeptidase family serine peptidase [Amycolatopsis saalfeldensis]SEP53123.1 Dipeptidyl aminopeptidase/acylaminoacyl peptidase [Amycolatopsis saalfeldensis]